MGWLETILFKGSKMQSRAQYLKSMQIRCSFRNKIQLISKGKIGSSLLPLPPGGLKCLCLKLFECSDGSGLTRTGSSYLFLFGNCFPFSFFSGHNPLNLNEKRSASRKELLPCSKSNPGSFPGHSPQDRKFLLFAKELQSDLPHLPYAAIGGPSSEALCGIVLPCAICTAFHIRVKILLSNHSTLY